jgi:hypothetical protein
MGLVLIDEILHGVTIHILTQQFIILSALSRRRREHRLALSLVWITSFPSFRDLGKGIMLQAISIASNILNSVREAWFLAVWRNSGPLAVHRLLSHLGGIFEFLAANYPKCPSKLHLDLKKKG